MIITGGALLFAPFVSEQRLVIGDHAPGAQKPISVGESPISMPNGFGGATISQLPTASPFRHKHRPPRCKHLPLPTMSAFNSPLNNNETGNRREPYFVADDSGVSLDHFYIPAHYQETLKEMLVPHGMLVDRIEKLAADIARDYQGLTIHFLVVLKGSQR